MRWHDAYGRDVRPFLAVAVVGLLTLLLPPYAAHGAAQLPAGLAAVVVTAGLAWLAIRLPPGHRFVDVPPEPVIGGHEGRPGTGRSTLDVEPSSHFGPGPGPGPGAPG